MLWAGPGYEQSYYVALFTMIPVTVPLIQNTGLNILYAMNKHRFRSVIYACIAILNVVLTLNWVEPYGILGAAAATCFAYTVGNVLIINWYYYRRIGIDIPEFWREILRMAPLMAAFTLGGLGILSHVPVDTWGKFLAGAAVYTLLYWPAAYGFMMNRSERELCRTVLRGIRRLWKRRG